MMHSILHVADMASSTGLDIVEYGDGMNPLQMLSCEENVM